MAFTSVMFDELRDLLGDATDAQVPFATKKLWLNRGIANLWPDVFQIVEDVSITTADSLSDYALPAAVQDGYITSVEIQYLDTADYTRAAGYDIIDGDEDLAGVLRLTGVYPGNDLNIRIRYAAPVGLITSATYAASQAETWTGPDRALHAPVLYAMSMIAGRKLDNRQDTYRYSTTQATNGVSDVDIMDAARFWMNQFELEVEKLGRPRPISKD